MSCLSACFSSRNAPASHSRDISVGPLGDIVPEPLVEVRREDLVHFEVPPSRGEEAEERLRALEKGLAEQAASLMALEQRVTSGEVLASSVESRLSCLEASLA